MRNECVTSFRYPLLGGLDSWFGFGFDAWLLLRVNGKPLLNHEATYPKRQLEGSLAGGWKGAVRELRASAASFLEREWGESLQGMDGTSATQGRALGEAHGFIQSDGFLA